MKKTYEFPNGSVIHSMDMDDDGITINLQDMRPIQGVEVMIGFQ